MMSLSDKDKQNKLASDEWVPLDPNSLQHIEDEKNLTKEKNKPDYNLFKLIYEDPQKREQEIFKPLIEPDEERDISKNDELHDFKELFTEHDRKKDHGTEVDFSSGPSSGTDAAGGYKAEFHAQHDGYGAGRGISDSVAVGDSKSFNGFDQNISDSIKSDPELKPASDTVSRGNSSGDSGSLHNVDLDSDKAEVEEGYEKGFQQGSDKGQDKGLAEGRAIGEEKGYAEGYAKGYAKGENEAKKVCDAKAGEILSSLENIVVKMNDAWSELVKKYENEIISLVCRIAEKVVLAKVDLDDQIVRQSILCAMDKMPEPEEINLYVSPDDYEYIEMVKEDLFDKIKGLTSVSLESDTSITKGGCRVQSVKAKIDTSIESRLEEVFSSIVKAGEL